MGQSHKENPTDFIGAAYLFFCLSHTLKLLLQLPDKTNAGLFTFGQGLKKEGFGEKREHLSRAVANNNNGNGNL